MEGQEEGVLVGDGRRMQVIVVRTTLGQEGRGGHGHSRASASRGGWKEGWRRTFWWEVGDGIMQVIVARTTLGQQWRGGHGHSRACPSASRGWQEGWRRAILCPSGCRWLARGWRGGRSRPAWGAKRHAGEPTIVVCRTLAVPVPNHHRIYSQTFTFLITKTGNREAGGSSPPGGA